jgi:hypothetical protein
MEALLSKNEQLCIKLPSTAEEWNKARRGFESRSAHSGCCRALGGFFQPTDKPTTKYSNENTTAASCYYSGHSKIFGLNVRAAACDAQLRFLLYFGNFAAGKTNGTVASCDRARTKLRDAISSIAIGIYFVGDSAYTLSEHLRIPFTGSKCLNSNNDAPSISTLAEYTYKLK